MESGNGGASSKGVLLPVSATSDVFQNAVLAPLKSAYLYEESKQSFRYKSAVFIKNPALEEKYNAFRAKRGEVGYSEEDLTESYGFLLFDDVNKANALGETGVLTGNSTCTTLGDPSHGVYISMYSDCLDLNRWYHGKSGYIAIIRLTKGRVKKVLENYTQNFTAPTEGFDCHVSEQLPSVSPNTSSFLAFERTQYYMYELLDDGSTAQSPSAACPFAIVSFSYTDTKATLVAPQEKSEEKKQVCHYFPWRGQLEIGTQLYDVGLRSTAGALIPAELPPVVKVDRTISMLDLRQLLPRAVFESCFSGEVFLDGLYCSLCELVSPEVEETSLLSLLLWEIKEKDVALTVTLKDGGFLILLHTSYFLTYDDTGSSATEVLQGIFVFPDSRVIQRDTKFGQRKSAISSEILRILPVLTYAEGEVEKTLTDPNEELCEVLVQHMQSYASLINPGLGLSPSREVSIFPDQYDVPDAYKHLYSSPEWTNRAWQSFRSYLSKPLSFQLPVSKVSEILAAGQEERIEDLDDDVYICLSSPEEAPVNHVSMDSEDHLTGQKSPVNVETSVDGCITSADAQVDLPAVPQNVVPDDLQDGNAAKDTEKADLTVLIKTDTGTKNLLTPSTSDDLPAELIVSITSAERTVTSVISTESATKHNDFQLSGFTPAKLQTAGVTSLNDETVKTKKVSDCPEVTNLTKTKRRKLRRGRSYGRKKVAKTPSLQTVTIPVEDDNLKSQREEQAKESSGHPQLNDPSNNDWRKVRRRKRKFGKLLSNNKKVRSDTVGSAVAEERRSHPGQQSYLMEVESCPLRKKTERWDLKPVISECGRILVPHGSVDIADQIKSLKDKRQCTKEEHCSEKMLADVSANAHDKVEIEQESSTAPEMAVNKTEATTSKDGGNLLQTIVVSDMNPQHSSSRWSDDGNGSLALNPESSEHSSKNEDKDTPSSGAVQEKHTDTPSQGKCATKGEFLLSKLKSVLLRGKRKLGVLVSGAITTDTAQDAEPCLKKGKVDSDTEMLKSNEAVTSVQDTNVGVSEASNTLSVDPLFAYALGLTPKQTPDKIQKTEGQDTQQRKDSPETKEQTFLDKQQQIMQRPPSIFPRRGRIKTLKKHQSISAEHVKKKWWLHFQTPACFAREKLNYNECTRDNSVRKTVKEKMNSACSSTDALNLLADLALASNDQVPPQPDPALEREPETRLKKCDLTKDVTSAEQESVLHALLRQPAARPIQPLESPSPSHLVGGSELVGLVSKEHAYSLPPSSSLLLGLSGTPFQVSPLSGSTRLLHHHQTMYGGGIKTLHPSVCQEDRSEHNHRTPEYLKKHMMRRRKFRHSRTFVNKDESIQVTKQWKENYDFNLDSKFTSDPKDKAIIRALHGPWDFSIQDTAEEVRLIVHMWIGLFYSRSTARFFHVDSTLTCPSSEDSDSFEISGGMVSAPAQPELKASSFFPFPSVTDTSNSSISKALDLSKKDDSLLDLRSVILDLSLKNTNAETVTSDLQINRKKTSVSGVWKDTSETLKTLKSSMGLQEASTSQCCKIELSTEVINEMNDVKSTHENKRTLQKAFKGDRTFISAKEETESCPVQPGNHQTVSGVGHLLHGCNNEKMVMKDGIVNSEPTEMTLVQQHGRDSSKSVTDEEVDSNKEAGDALRTLEHDQMQSKEVKEKPYQEGNIQLSPKMIHTSDDSTDKESGMVCNGNLSENETQLSREDTKAVSPGKAGNVNEDVDCCTGDDSTKEESGLACNGNLSESKTQLSREDTEVSPCKAENVNEDVDYCTVHESQVTKDDHFEKEDELDEKDSCISAVKADSDLSDQPLPTTCDGPDSVKKDCITECNRQAPLEEQPPQADDVKEVCHDLQLRKLCANGNALTDEHANSEKPPLTPSEMEPICNEPIIKDDHFEKEDELYEKDSCVSAVEAHSDLSDQQLPMMCDGPDSVKKDCIMECNWQVPLEEQSPQADDVKEVCHDLQLRNGNELTDEHAISEKAPLTPSEMELIYTEPAVEDSSENDICVADKAQYQKMGQDGTLDGSYSDGSTPQTTDGVETGSQNRVMANVNPSNDDHEDRDTRSTEEEQKVDNTTEKELFHHQPDSPQCEAINRSEAEVALNKQMDLKRNKTNEGLENIRSRIVIPFIGVDTSGEDTVPPYDPHSRGSDEEVVQGYKEIPFISETACTETVLPTEACSTSQIYSKKAERSAGKVSLSLLDVIKTNQPEVLGSESDDQCPTPTMDEKPFEYLTCSGPSSSISTVSYTDKDEMLLERKLGHKSTVNSDPHPHRGLHPDLELRTLRVLQSIDKFLSKSNHTDESTQIKTADKKHSLDQTNNPSIKYIPTCLASSHTSADFKDKKMSNTKPAVVSASTSQELHTESSGHFFISPFSKLEEVLGVQLKKTDSSHHQHYFERTDKLQELSVGQDYCHPYRSFPSTECLQAIKPNVDQDRHKTTSQTNLSNEPRSNSQRPVMAVKPSKSEEIQADCISKDKEIENCLMSVFSKTKVTYSTSSPMLLEKRTESLGGNSEGRNDLKQKASELSSKSTWLPNVSDNESNSDKVKFALLDPLCWYEGLAISKFNKIPSSSLPVQSESAKTSSKLVDGNQGFLSNNLVEKVGQTTEESMEMDQRNCLDSSTSVVDYIDDSIINDSLYLGPQSSLTCTVYNTNQKRCDSFMEQLSQRCVQDDLTQVSMERECLIFSEQMKQVLKRSKRKPNSQPDADDKLNLSCPSPVTVHFSSLEEQEDSVDHLDAPSLVGQKIKVDMSDRKDLTDTTEEEKTVDPQKLGNPMEHAGVSAVTAECASVYTAIMNDVCASRKVPSRPKHLMMEKGYIKTEPSNHFDFCDQMKREMDESFRSNLNSVVKKSCKTKYRFYILMTSEDAFFEETKAQLEAEGHTAVQPSEFFLGEDSSSSLLIILRNEDIAEHICEVPHLLELKKSPWVQFAGIDEPDDVVNLTHQELFMRGGFVMFSKAALESLSVCNMKKMTEILQELSRTGKWKWMLHYRDSRRLKENARLSAEAKEKKHFLNWCQEAGVLEVLPYHECDLMSRDQPDYLTCLVHLQVQNISARYPVFITDTTTDSVFGTNGILTMTVNSFLTCSPSQTFTV